MRKIKIVSNTCADSTRISRKFIDSTGNSDEVLDIICAYEPAQICFPDCAACEIVSQTCFSTAFNKAVCDRGNFEIGILK